MKHEVITAWT